MNDVEVVILKDNQWIRLKLTAFKWSYTNEGMKFEIEGYEDDAKGGDYANGEIVNG